MENYHLNRNLPLLHTAQWVKEPEEITSTPTRTREPCLHAIEKVVRNSAIQLCDTDKCTVAFHAAGAFNRVYLVRFQRQSPDQKNDNPWETLVMRVSLPVNPGQKTHGERVTLQWLNMVPNLPIRVPKVYDWDETNNNDIGFEWILMEFMPGKTLQQRWRRMTMRQKSDLVKRLVEFEAMLLQPQFSHEGIGTLCHTGDPHVGSQNIKPGIMCARHFFWHNHCNYDLDRGPFRSAHDWLESHLNFTIRDRADRLANAAVLSDRERNACAMALGLARKLLHHLPAFLKKPQPSDRPVTTYLWHNDLNLRNILVDDQGAVTAIVDWETVSCEPFFVRLTYPKFLRGADLEGEPFRDFYEDSNEPDEDGLDNEGKHSDYWDDLMDYETTQLRKVYRRHMEQMCCPTSIPQGLKYNYELSRAVGFMTAVEECAFEPDAEWFEDVETWLQAQVGGLFPSSRLAVRRQASGDRTTWGSC